ncbi:MAG TPA: ADOP family duplicated permease [Gemmatimonadaceae bacterium]|nr:ADOP family duplicated permease [Gemmatimonadaceae bacterium]
MLELMRTLAFRARSWVRRGALDTELAEEMRLHRELLEADARRAGLSEDAARQAAALKFGNATVLRERSRDWWSFGWLEAAAQDVRYAARFLRRSPGFTVVAILSLALGIGANAAVFTVIDGLLLKPPAHIVDPGRVVNINVLRDYPGQRQTPYTPALSFGDVYALRESATSFESVVAFSRPSLVRLGRGPDAPRIKESKVSGDFFQVLGVRPAAGRFFQPEDDVPSAERTAVISYGFWQRHFAGTHAAIGSRITTSGLDFTVIGVAPRGFSGVVLDAADVWVPLEPIGDVRIWQNWKNRRGFAARAFARLRNGVTPEAASAEATLILQRLPDDTARYGAVTETVQVGSIIPARGPAVQGADVIVSMRLGQASALVLLAACANLATLLLLRALTRRREIAVRMAVGISRRRLVGQLLLESLLLSLAGALAALIAARWGGSALRGLVFPQATWATGPVDGRVFGFAVLCAIVVALLAGLAPAVRLTRADVAVALRSAAPQLTVSTGRLRQALLVLQVALSVVLMVGATAFVQSVRRAHAFDMGYDLDRLVVGRMFLESDTQSTAGRTAMLDEAARRVARLPGVARVVVAPVVPLLGSSSRGVVLPDRPPRPDERLFVGVYDVTPELIETLGLRLVSGRWIQSGDVRGAPPVLLATEEMARRFWPGQSPLGRCVKFGSDTAPCHEVVGVVRDVRTMELREETLPVAFLAAAQQRSDNSFFTGMVVARTSRDAEEMAPAVRDVLRGLHPDLASLEIRPLAALLEREYQPLRLGATMFGVFALLAILLAGVGLYGILAFSVAQRTGEIGIRTALGARAKDLIALVSGEAIRLVTFGLVIGAAASWLAARTVEGLLFNSSARATSPYVIAGLLLLAVAAAASAVPMRRAAKVDPVTALRAE